MILLLLELLVRGMERSHGFTSVQAAKYLGGSIFQRYGWKVSLENFDIHVWGHVYKNSFIFGIILSPEPSITHRKSRLEFSQTALNQRYIHILF